MQLEGRRQNIQKDTDIVIAYRYVIARPHRSGYNQKCEGRPFLRSKTVLIVHGPQEILQCSETLVCQDWGFLPAGWEPTRFMRYALLALVAREYSTWIAHRPGI